MDGLFCTLEEDARHPVLFWIGLLRCVWYMGNFFGSEEGGTRCPGGKGKMRSGEGGKKYVYAIS